MVFFPGRIEVRFAHLGLDKRNDHGVVQERQAGRIRPAPSF